MPRFRTKIREVDAIQFTRPLTISGSSDEIADPTEVQHVTVGDWLLTHPDGTQETVSDTEFRSQYEEVHVVHAGVRPSRAALLRSPRLSVGGAAIAPAARPQPTPKRHDD